VSDTNLYNMP